MKIPTKSMEFWLLGWNESHSGGCKVTFQVSPHDLEHFRAATVRKGKVAGQRYAAVLVELGEDEKPIDPEAVARKHTGKFPGGLTGLAVKWCLDPHFQDWVDETVMRTGIEGLSEIDVPDAEERAKRFVLLTCGINSRNELNEGPAAAERFTLHVKYPYAKQREHDGLNG